MWQWVQGNQLQINVDWMLNSRTILVLMNGHIDKETEVLSPAPGT